jgi:hypothetical protein
MIMMIMLMVCNYVSELWLQTGLLFTPQVIYEHGKSPWKIDTEKLLIHPPQLSGNSTSSHLATKQDTAKEIMNFAYGASVYLT